MPKFKEGDVVRVIKGWNEGEEGTVTNPYFQIAANDWPFVLFTDAEGNRHSADESNMILVEDPTCEYAMAIKDDKEPGGWRPVGDIMDRYDSTPIWGERGPRQKMLEWYMKDFTHTQFKLVKRKKAGPIEDV